MHWSPVLVTHWSPRRSGNGTAEPLSQSRPELEQESGRCAVEPCLVEFERNLATTLRVLFLLCCAAGVGAFAGAPALYGTLHRCRSRFDLRRRRQRPDRMAEPVLRYAGPPGQDPTELFEVCEPPPEGNDGFASEVQRTGVMKQRSLVHRDGDWHRSVDVWVGVPSSRQLVLQKRSAHKDTNPNCWDVSAAGHITGSDSSLDTAVREVQEELGLASASSDTLTLLFTSVYQGKGSTPKHGAYEDNEYQDVYFHPLPDAVSLQQFDLGTSEVSAVKLVSVM